MDCFMCRKTKMLPYFEKNSAVGMTFQFLRCPSCGMVINQTIYDMTEAEWEKLNSIHKDYQGTDSNPVDPDWIDRLHRQAELLARMYQAGGIFHRGDRIVDWGCGDGKLSQYFEESIRAEEPAHMKILKYDKYMRVPDSTDYLQDGEMTPGSFDAVISCSVLEHLRGKKQVETIFDLAKNDGTVVVHTLICEEVPKDPDWFYIDFPAHCTIWTNEAMSQLYREYGFIGCAYHVEARMWFFFRSHEKFERLKTASGAISGTWAFSDSFVDYWKRKPYRGMDQGRA